MPGGTTMGQAEARQERMLAFIRGSTTERFLTDASGLLGPLTGYNDKNGPNYNGPHTAAIEDLRDRSVGGRGGAPVVLAEALFGDCFSVAEGDRTRPRRSMWCGRDVDRIRQRIRKTMSDRAGSACGQQWVTQTETVAQ